ncbi:lysophospholipid acyltransferase family protein [Phytopseudomonas dryadis]|uniref:1-acyl-sn-glycerol-3-phosphate acyltransferase n=1 Tax=Phytopseudomonas dryadis TaxID=2487520 RepID=A0A4Q9QU34_9GAMM|nr:MULTISPECIES: lysophospholipid acyltransferase family protein [Pseudomonas]TBU86562.1 1-acyl-sn-glycerol-3-phosphate acyltransferase [Pseudomonas dryadis]TBV07240.1 1-acyl-sn-glycerol-3-phosphate acyltransferase [Pseudomonas dryadis]TBV13419.1 1-acyl-sn-glycerol-3-phosphate acyltransferase [Pseudomonas sp. FRB 230]
MGKLRLYLRLARLLAVIGLGLLLATLFTPLERLTRRDLMGLRQRLTRWFLARLGNALPFRLQVHGELPRTPMLWLSNHVSWADIPLLGRLAPLSFLSKAEVRTWPLAGWLAHKAGTLFIRRGAGDGSLLNQQLGRHLQQGRHLLIFPEGTTGDGTSLRTFHGRLLSSAIESGVALQPVAIRYLRDGQPCRVAPFIGDDDMLSHLLRLLDSDIAEVHIQLLEPIDSQSGNRNELARRAQAAVAQALYGETSVRQAA